MMPTLVGQVTGFCSTNLILFTVFVDKFHSDNLLGQQNYLLEPNNFFVEKYPVAMASCLVDITHEVTNKVNGIYQQTHL
jgi:hypothetical protein